MLHLNKTLLQCFARSGFTHPTRGARAADLIRKKRAPRQQAIGIFKALSVFSLSSGCTDLPDEYLIENTRVLAIRAHVQWSPFEDIEPDEQRPRAEALPLESITFDTLIATPQGPIPINDLDSLWIACEMLPETGTGACLREYISRQDPILSGLVACPPPAIEKLIEGDIDARSQPCWVPTVDGVPSHQIPATFNILLGASMEYTMIASLAEGPGALECANRLLTGDHELPDTCLYAVTKTPIGPPELIAQAAAELGITQVPEMPPAIPESDRHARITEAFFTPVVDEMPIGETLPVIPGAIIRAPINAELRFDVTAPDSDLQEYPILINQGESTEMRLEAYFGIWYRSWGTLARSNSSLGQTFNTWTLTPGDDDVNKVPGDIVHLFYVVRDGRAGIAWKTFQVQLDAPVIATSH